MRPVLNELDLRMIPWMVYPFDKSSSVKYEPSWPVIPVMSAFFISSHWRESEAYWTWWCRPSPLGRGRREAPGEGTRFGKTCHLHPPTYVICQMRILRGVREGCVRRPHLDGHSGTCLQWPGRWLHSVGFPDSRRARHTKTPGSDIRGRSWVPNRSRAAIHRTHGRAVPGHNTRRPGFFAEKEGKDRFQEA